jgi:hypothetical protein
VTCEKSPVFSMSFPREIPPPIRPIVDQSNAREP